MEPWLLAQGYQLTSTRFFESTNLPNPEEIDFLIIMGGPMSVNDEDKFSWLALEKQFIREVISAGIPVLGICLGAQLIANAMGASVFPNAVKEIGWLPIHAVISDDCEAFTFPAIETVFHWHGETFDLPLGAIALAKSEGCENQAFQLGESVIGLQFHLETTPESAKEIIVHCGDELVPSKYVQTAEEILSAGAGHYQSINLLMEAILGFLQRSTQKRKQAS